VDVGDSPHGYSSDVLGKGVVGVLQGCDLVGAASFGIGSVK
jgi:hypothetical protein